MLDIAIEQERLFIAERLLSETERRHGLSHPANRELHPLLVDRFLVAYLPPTCDGIPAPAALDYAFTPTLLEALDFLRRTVKDVPDGRGAAAYVHDLDTGVAAGT